MRRILLLMVAVLCITVASAQEKGETAVGAQVVYGSGDGLSNIGIGAKFQWNVINRLRLEPSFTYFLKKDNINMWNAGVNVHYLLPVADAITLYPVAGAGIWGIKVSVPEMDLGEYGNYGGGSASNSEFGFNIGAGADFNLSEKFVINAELKYKVGGDWSRLLISAGVAYKF